MKVSEPRQAMPLLEKLKNYKREHFVIILIGQNNEALKVVDVTKHSHKNWCEFQQRDIYKEALLSNALGLLIAHNHPGGKLHPSKYDEETTRTLVEGAKLLGLTVFDHLIVTRDGYFSFLEHNIFNKKS